MGTRTFGEKGYHKCSNEVSQVPCAHFPKIFSNGQWGNFLHLIKFGGNRHKTLGVPLFLKCPFVPVPNVPSNFLLSV